MGQRAVPRLLEALGHAEPLVRRLAAQTLGKTCRCGEAVPALLRLLGDPDEHVREAAAEALRKAAT
jgi:HEAT repeat protein